MTTQSTHDAPESCEISKADAERIGGEVTHPADGVGGYALYRHPATGIYTVDIPSGVPRVLRSCPQDWARAQHLRAMVRALPHTRDALCAASRAAGLHTLILPLALDASFRFSCDP